MALISNLEEANKKYKTSIHKPVARATVSIIDGHETKVVQIDTFTIDNPNPEKGNKQAIQLDRKSAGLLLEVIRRAFPDLK